jgi:hypothetical protein
VLAAKPATTVARAGTPTLDTTHGRSDWLDKECGGLCVLGCSATG